MLTCYLTIAQVSYVRWVPDHRGRITGAVPAGLQTAQGLGVLLAGALAEPLAPSTAIGACAAAGVLLATVLAVVGAQARYSRRGLSGNAARDSGPHAATSSRLWCSETGAG